MGYTLESGSVNHMVHHNTSFYTDNDGRMGPDTILEHLDKFVDNTDNKSVLGVGHSVVWLKLELVNESRNQQWNLFFPSQDYRRVEVFEVQDARLIFLGRSGYEVPSEDRTIQTLENSFPIVIPQGESKVYLARIESRRGVIYTKVVDDRELSLHSLRNLWVRFCHSGIVSMIIVVSIVIFILTREISYLFYALFSIAMFFRVLIPSGVFDFYLDTKSAFFGEYLGSSTLAVVTAALLFCVYFLDTRHYYPKVFKSILVLSGAGFLLFLFSLGPNRETVTKFSDPINGLGMAISLGLGFATYFRGFAPARYYLVGWGAFISCVLVWMLNQRNLVPHGFFVDNAPIIGNIFEMIFISVALSDRNRYQQNMVRDLELKQQESSSLRRLIRVLVHDLSNPLSVVSSLSAIYKNKDCKTRSGWEKVSRAAETIIAIIEDIRGWEAIESGKQTMELQAVSVRELFASVAFLFEQKLKSKNVELIIDFPPEEDVFVVAEPISLSNSVVNNLISNAIKFTPNGNSVILSCQLQGEFVEISVQDSGIGMPQEILENLFDPSAQTSRLGTAKEKGTGFGMPLVKSYITLYGGEIEVESQEGSGTTVSFKLTKSEAQGVDKVAV